LVPSGTEIVRPSMISWGIIFLYVPYLRLNLNQSWPIIQEPVPFPPASLGGEGF
jgi:hypothetical protein